MERVCYTDDERWRALDDFESLVEKGLVRIRDYRAERAARQAAEREAAKRKAEEAAGAA